MNKGTNSCNEINDGGSSGGPVADETILIAPTAHPLRSSLFSPPVLDGLVADSYDDKGGSVDKVRPKKDAKKKRSKDEKNATKEKESREVSVPRENAILDTASRKQAALERSASRPGAVAIAAPPARKPNGRDTTEGEFPEIDSTVSEDYDRTPSIRSGQRRGNNVVMEYKERMNGEKGGILSMDSRRTTTSCRPGAHPEAGLEDSDESRDFSIEYSTPSTVPTALPVDGNQVFTATTVPSRNEVEMAQRLAMLETERNNVVDAQEVVVKDGYDESKAMRLLFVFLILGIATIGLVIAIPTALIRTRGEKGTRGMDNGSEGGDALPTLPPTLDIIHKRGYIKCRGESFEVRQGHGFSVDLCSALAAAILGNKSAYEMPLIPFNEQWASISNGTMDISTTQTTANMQRDIREPLSQYGYTFSTPYYYSGTTFAGIPEYIDCINRGDTLVGICRELSICALEDSTYTKAVAKYFDGSQKLVAFSEDLFDNFANGTCNVVTGSPLLIYEQRVRDAGYKGEYLFASRLYDREPFALTTRGDDAEFGDFVNWVLRSLIVAETMNLTNSTSQYFPMTHLFGEEYHHMFQNAIAAVGNYGDMYQRSLSSRSPRLEGGINTQHLYERQGGLLYANPLSDLSVGEDGGKEVRLEPNGTLESIISRRSFKCGLILSDLHGNSREGLAAFSNNTMEGIDVSYCHGITAALFAGRAVDNETLFMAPYATLEEGFLALANGEIDMLAGATYSMENDVKEPTTGVGFAFSDVYYYYKGNDSDYDVHPLAMATREDDPQWTDFVRSMVTGTIHAEASDITRANAIDMPVIELFGDLFRQSLRDVILTIGNYAEIYEENMERHLPRSMNTRNTLNSGGSPQFYTNWKFD